MSDSLSEKTRNLLHDLMNELATIKLAMHLARNKSKDSGLENFFAKSEESIGKIEKMIEAYKRS